PSSSACHLPLSLAWSSLPSPAGATPAISRMPSPHANRVFMRPVLNEAGCQPAGVGNRAGWRPAAVVFAGDSPGVQGHLTRPVALPRSRGTARLQPRRAIPPDTNVGPCGAKAMSDPLPRTVARELQFDNGPAIGISNRWLKGQYCSILTPAGIVGCGIY